MKYRRCTGKRALYTVLFAAAVMFLSCLFGKNLAMAKRAEAKLITATIQILK